MSRYEYEESLSNQTGPRRGRESGIYILHLHQSLPMIDISVSHFPGKAQPVFFSCRSIDVAASDVVCSCDRAKNGNPVGGVVSLSMSLEGMTSMRLRLGTGGAAGNPFRGWASWIKIWTFQYIRSTVWCDERCH